MEKLQVVNEVWDIKKILAGIFIIGVIIFTAKIYVLDKNLQNENLGTKLEGASVKSDKTIALPSQDLKKDLNQRLNDLKEDVNSINVVEVATSSPAVQKILNDLKNLQNLPQNQAKEACFNICNGL